MRSTNDNESTTSSRGSSKSSLSLSLNHSTKSKRDIRHGLDDSDDEGHNSDDSIIENVPRINLSPKRKTKKSNDRGNKAKEDYREVMQRLRRPHQSSATLTDTSRDTNKRKPALLETQDVIDPDNWLDDDLGPNKKKQKFLTDSDYAPQAKRRSKELIGDLNSRNRVHKSPTPSPSRRSSTSLAQSPYSGHYSTTPVRNSRLRLNSLSPSPQNHRTDTSRHEKSPFHISPLYSSSPLIDSTNRELVFDDFQIDDDTPIWQNPTPTERRSMTTNFPVRQESTRRRQSTLTDAGFHRVHSPTIEKDSLPDSTTYSASYDDSIPFANESPGVNFSRRSTIKSIAVHIDTELISVPVRSDEVDRLTVGWLVKEAANRFSSLYGRIPDMQLTLNNAVMIH